MKYSIQAHSDAATLYLFDDVGANEEAYLRTQPRTLAVLRNAIQYWRRHRGMVVELHATERLVLVLSEFSERRAVVILRRDAAATVIGQGDQECPRDRRAWRASGSGAASAGNAIA